MLDRPCTLIVSRETQNALARGSRLNKHETPFVVQGDGVGTASVNVGSNGAAFGVADNTAMTVMDLLLATDAQAVNGVLYGGNASRRNQANNVFSAVNQAGGI